MSYWKDHQCPRCKRFGHRFMDCAVDLDLEPVWEVVRACFHSHQFKDGVCLNCGARDARDARDDGDASHRHTNKRINDQNGAR